MENILKVFLMAFPEWLACIFMVVGLVVTALAAVRLGYGLVVAKTVYKWIVNAEEKFGSGAGFYGVGSLLGLVSSVPKYRWRRYFAYGSPCSWI